MRKKIELVGIFFHFISYHSFNYPLTLTPLFKLPPFSFFGKVPHSTTRLDSTLMRCASLKCECNLLKSIFRIHMLKYPLPLSPLLSLTLASCLSSVAFVTVTNSYQDFLAFGFLSFIVLYFRSVVIFSLWIASSCCFILLCVCCLFHFSFKWCWFYCIDKWNFVTFPIEKASVCSFALKFDR